MPDEINRLRDELCALRSNISEIASRLRSAEWEMDSTRKGVEKCKTGIRAIEQARATARFRAVMALAVVITVVDYLALAHGFGWI
jgi:hypothetical protein